MKYANLNSLTLGDLFELYSDEKLSLQPTFLINYPLPKHKSSPALTFQSLFLGWVSNRRIVARQNAKNGYDILCDELGLSSILHFIENHTALPKSEDFGELGGKYFRDLPCVVQKSILQTNVNLVLFFAKDDEKLYQDIKELGF
jgi:hypothetical protein